MYGASDFNTVITMASANNNIVSEQITRSFTNNGQINMGNRRRNRQTVMPYSKRYRRKLVQQSMRNLESISMTPCDLPNVSDALSVSSSSCSLSDLDSDTYSESRGSATNVAINNEPDFREQLIEWAGAHDIKHTAIEGLLDACRTHSWGVGLPKTARALLNTARRIPLRKVEPGLYYHYGILRGLKGLKNLPTDGADINLYINVDGLPIFKSKGSDFWPILGKIPNHDQTFIIGVYYGARKPNDAADFLKEFIEEAICLINEGFTIQGRVYHLKIAGIIADAPARAFLLNIKGHTGFFSCTKCVIEGDYIENRTVYLEIDSSLRTDDSFRKMTQEEHHHGPSALCNLPHFDMIDSVPHDSMHLIYLGVMKKLICAWLKPAKRFPFKSTFFKREVSRRLIYLSPFIPCEFNRKPRPLDNVERFKATEFRQILHYLGPIIFESVLPEPYYKHFMLLHSAIRILCHPVLHTQLHAHAKKLLLSFVKNCRQLYGDQFMIYNIHSLLHITRDVQNHGPLDSFSAFPFETFLGRIKQLVRSSNRPLQQVAKRLSELNNRLINQSAATQQEGLLYEHSLGPIIPTDHPFQQFKSWRKGHMRITRDRPNNCVFLTDNSIIFIENLLWLKKKIYFLARKYETITDLYNYPIKSSHLNIFIVENLSSLSLFPTKKFKSKAICLPFHDRFAVFPMSNY